MPFHPINDSAVFFLDARTISRFLSITSADQNPLDSPFRILSAHWVEERRGWGGRSIMWELDG